MRSDHKEKRSKEVGVELKYCEHCGSLWVRECGAGIVYCDKCQPKVADLPISKGRPGRVILPVRRHTAMEDYQPEIEIDDSKDFEAAGGVA